MDIFFIPCLFQSYILSWFLRLFYCLFYMTLCDINVCQITWVLFCTCYWMFRKRVSPSSLPRILSNKMLLNVQYYVIFPCINLSQFIIWYHLCTFRWFPVWSYFEPLKEYFHVCNCTKDFLKHIPEVVLLGCKIHVFVELYMVLPNCFSKQCTNSPS